MGLIELIDERIKKFLDNFSTLNSSPCTVVEVLENEMVKAKLVENGAEYTVPNYSGSSVEVGEKVQLYYKGKNIQAGKSYVGASLNKGGGGGSAGEDVFGIMVSDDGIINTTNYMGIAAIGIRCSKLTNCYITINMNIWHDGSVGYLEADFDIINENWIRQGFQPEISYNTDDTGQGEFVLSYSIPISASAGEHRYYVRINSNIANAIRISSNYNYVRGIDIETFDVGVRTSTQDYIKYNASTWGTLFRYIGVDVTRIPQVLSPLSVNNEIHTCCFSDRELRYVEIPEGYTKIY